MKLGAVDTHLVVALHALLEERNVTRAARRLGLTQPTVSHALARLRRQLGDPLLVPVGRTLTLTEKGRALVEPAEQAVRSLERVFAPTPAFDPARSTRTFTIATPDNLAMFVLPGLVRALAREAPGIRIRCVNLTPDWPNALRRGEIDLKLGRAERKPPEGIASETLLDDQLVCVVRRGHPALRSRLTPKRYAALDHVVVTPRGDGPSAVDASLAALGLERTIVLTVPHFLVAPFVVARTDLVLTTSERVARTLLPALPIVQVACPLPLRKYGLAQCWAHRATPDEGLRFLRARIASDHASRAAP